MGNALTTPTKEKHRSRLTNYNLQKGKFKSKFHVMVMVGVARNARFVLKTKTSIENRKVESSFVWKRKQNFKLRTQLPVSEILWVCPMLVSPLLNLRRAYYVFKKWGQLQCYLYHTEPWKRNIVTVNKITSCKKVSSNLNFPSIRTKSQRRSIGSSFFTSANFTSNFWYIFLFYVSEWRNDVDDLKWTTPSSIEQWVPVF